MVQGPGDPRDLLLPPCPGISCAQPASPLGSKCQRVDAGSSHLPAPPQLRKHGHSVSLFLSPLEPISIRKWVLFENLCNLSPQQPNIKQKFVALLKRFKVSDEVRPLTPEVAGEWTPLSCTLVPGVHSLLPLGVKIPGPPSERAAKEGLYAP